LTSELERIKILEGKISQVVEYINKINSENSELKKQVRDLKAEKKTLGDEARRAGKLDESLKSFEKEREAIKTKVESIIGQIDQLEI
jgi:FtsZ-binding cell division protein ZapB